MSSLSLLVVEDDIVTLEMLQRRLTEAGYGVETAENGMVAADFISVRPFDVVLTDMIMPGDMDGIAVLEATKERWGARTDVIVITGYASVENAVEAMKKGATDYLTKPINFDELFLRLEKISLTKALARDASDLREAMDVTEKGAAETIQFLDGMVSGLQKVFSDVTGILTKDDIEPSERIRLAIEALEYVEDLSN
ncbi:MAG: response regulator [Thermodesulfobacteriota bacterium]|nr:response regulator [Thermodesulfobacteriota bacterium]